MHWPIKNLCPCRYFISKGKWVAHDALKDVQQMLENSLKLDLACQKDEEDLDQLDLNECVIDID